MTDIRATLRARIRAAFSAAAAAHLLPPLLLATPHQARAADAPAPLHYAGYVLGLHVFDMSFAVAPQPSFNPASNPASNHAAANQAPTYRADATFRLAGALGAIFHAEGATTVQGRFEDGRAVPQVMTSNGRYSGETHVLRMTWAAGMPAIAQMDPPVETGREPVPPREQANTVDMLSAIAALVRQVAQAGRCDATARTYDGARLAELTAQTAGQDNLPRTDLSSFQGAALRCDLTVRMTGGFMRDDDTPKARRAKRATVWFATARPGEPPMPVRIAFDGDGSPGAMAYLR